MIEGARKYAILRHNKANQTYDGKPYETHLSEVVNVVEEYKHLIRGFHERYEHLISAAWNHDVIEDTDTSYGDLEKEIGTTVADLVYRVTNELGKNRIERGMKTYPKTRESDAAIFLKLSDRIANTRRSKRNGHRMFKAYIKEYPTFRYALKKGHLFDEMWAHLDELYGYEES